MGNQKSAIDREHSKLYQILNYRLPPAFKKLGIISAVLILAGLFAYKFMGSNAPIVKDVVKTLLLLCMLVASLSKDVLEDEYNRQLRFQSYVVAFVTTTAYAILLPLVALIADLLITKITGDGSVSFHEVSAFEVIFILLGLQILFFETLKKFGRA